MILFYLVDDEILQYSQAINVYGYKSLMDIMEEKIRLILAFSQLDEYIIFSPSFLCESKLAYNLAKRCMPFVNEGFIKVYMREETFLDLRDKKIDNDSYGRLFTSYPNLKKAYSKENIKRVSKLGIPIERKTIKVGKNSFDEFVPRLEENAKTINYNVTELIKRLDYSERESFLWPSVLKQSSELFITTKIINRLQIRSLMNASYLDTFRAQGIKIPINTNIIPNPNFIPKNFNKNIIDVEKLRILSKTLNIFDCLINLSQQDFIRLRYDANFSLEINQIMQIVNNAPNFTKALEIIQNERHDKNVQRIISSYIFNQYKEVNKMKKNKIFIVHGHDNEAKEIMARELEKGGFEPIILHEQPSGGNTIIEKIEEYSNVAFAVVLYTACDIGRSVKDDSSAEKYRARQNVVFEHGYLIAKLGRKKVAAFVRGDIETPKDIDGVVYIEMDNKKAWKMQLAKELERAGLSIDTHFYD